ncbi:MAG TPA: lipid-binding SYLF domain-containing protein [Tepidisphaeraceae bacterium]
MNLIRARRWCHLVHVASVLPLLASGVIGCGGKGASTSSTPSQAAGATPASATTAPSAQANSDAAKMVELGRTHTNKLFGYKQTEGLRNMLGGAQGIFVAPNVAGGAFLVGVDNGTGFLMRRHNDDWSDPVFYTITQTSAGMQLGVKNSQFIVLLMTDTAVDNFIHGRMQMGGSGGLTLGVVGISAAGAGGVDSGLESLIVATSQGAALGSGVATIVPKSAANLNAQAYGAHTDKDLQSVLARPGGTFAPATPFRQDLTRMVRHAWDIRNAPGQPVAANAAKR